MPITSTYSNILLSLNKLKILVLIFSVIGHVKRPIWVKIFLLITAHGTNDFWENMVYKKGHNWINTFLMKHKHCDIVIIAMVRSANWPLVDMLLSICVFLWLFYDQRFSYRPLFKGILCLRHKYFFSNFWGKFKSWYG
jgi:hypothetical protein